jgi:RNA polymerase sigma factor (sigma-70 family)
MVPVLLAQKSRFLAFLEERVGSRAGAEDLLQAAMLRVMTKGRSLRDRDRVVPWFYRMLQNLVVDWRRRRAAAERALRRLDADARATQAHDEPLWRQVCTCVTAILTTLRPTYADILQRVEIDGQSLTGVARSLGISANNASVRLLRARRALLERLRAACGACFEHGCLDCFCRTAQAVGSGAPRPPPRGGGRRCKS